MRGRCDSMSLFIERPEMRALPALVSFMLTVVFIIPMTHGIVNIGNIAGTAVCGALTLVIVFFGRFTSLVSRMWTTPAGRAAACIIGGFAAVCILLAALISVFMVRAAHDPPPDSGTTLIVLGCKVKNGRPSKMLARRIDAAYEYMSEHPDSVAVVSGGQGSDELISEAQCMRGRLVEMGIAPERIYMEDRSTDTEENLRFSLDIISRESLAGDITIVTDGFHQLRAQLIAKRLGAETYSVSARTPWWLVPTYWVREWFGTAYFFVSR